MRVLSELAFWLFDFARSNRSVNNGRMVHGEWRSDNCRMRGHIEPIFEIPKSMRVFVQQNQTNGRSIKHSHEQTQKATVEGNYGENEVH